MFWKIRLKIANKLLNITVLRSIKLFSLVCDIFEKETKYITDEREKELENIQLPEYMLTEEYQKRELEQIHTRIRLSQKSKK